MFYFQKRELVRTLTTMYLLRFRRLIQLYSDDMYIKMKMERLTFVFIRFNQAILYERVYPFTRCNWAWKKNEANIDPLTIPPETYLSIRKIRWHLFIITIGQISSFKRNEYWYVVQNKFSEQLLLWSFKLLRCVWRTITFNFTVR